MKTIKRDHDWPFWAEWLAMDYDGEWYVFKYRPASQEYIWHHPSGITYRAGNALDFDGDWEKSLHKIVDEDPSPDSSPESAPKMKTIKRDPSRPTWANYQTTDFDGRTVIWDTQPIPHALGRRWCCTELFRAQIIFTERFNEPNWSECIWQIVDNDEEPTLHANDFLVKPKTGEPIIATVPAQDGAPKMREFDTGATRNVDDDKLDFEGCLSPLVLQEFAKYMHKHRRQADGKLRDSDNWQKGIPKTEYAKSAWRHFFDFWMLHRGYQARSENGKPVTMLEALMGLRFNIQGYAHEILKGQAQASEQEAEALDDE